MTVKGFEKGNFIAPTIVSNVTVSKRDCPHSFCVCSEGAFHFAKDLEISVGIQIKRSVSVSSDRSICVHLWWWSTDFGRNIPIETRCSIFDKPVPCPN